MAILSLILIVNCALGLALTPLAARLARRIGLLDRPDGQRKIHSGPVPLAGGLAIFIALCLSLVVGRTTSSEIADWFEQSRISLPGLIAAGAILCLVGVIDDRVTLRGRHKLAGQLLAIVVLLASGVTIESIDLFGLTIPLGLFALPATIFWLLGAINSLNLIDGMDGMVGCVGGGIALAIAALSLLTGQFAAAFIALALLGAIAGFLCFNLPPARVYLGDCGSMIIGMMIGVLALQTALKGPTTVMLTIPVALFTIPILDSAAAIARRTLTGRSIYTADRGHLHHCLERGGLSNRRILLLVSFLCLLTGLGALASLMLQRQLFAAVAGVTVIAMLLLTRLFGHSELLLLRKGFAAFLLHLRHGRDGRRIHELCVHLQGSADWQKLWFKAIAAANRLRSSSVRLDINIPAIQEHYHARQKLGPRPDEAQTWRFAMPLALRGRQYGRIEMHGLLDAMPMSERMGIFATVAEDLQQSIGLILDRRQAARPAQARAQARPAGSNPSPLSVVESI